MAQPDTARANHVVSLRANLLVFAALMVLLALTVVAAQFDLGLLSVAIALAIAACKAVLIILYFMHIRYSSRLSWVFAGVGFIWLGILIVLMMSDYASRSWMAAPPGLGSPLSH